MRSLNLKINFNISSAAERIFIFLVTNPLSAVFYSIEREKSGASVEHSGEGIMNWLYTLVFAGLLFNSGSKMESPLGRINFYTGDYQTSRQAGLEETETIERTFPLAKGGRVGVSNVNGSIEIEAWDRDEVHLVAVKSANSREALENVDIRIDAVADCINIRADYKNRTWRENDARSRDNLTVNFRLKVPRDAVLEEIGTVNGTIIVSGFSNRVKASAVNGSVRGLNLSGAISLSTVNGEVYADFDRLEGKGRINLETVNGRIVLLLPSNSDAVLKADTLNGNITNDVGFTVRKSGYLGRDLAGKIGSGSVGVRLSSVNGAIVINRKSDGRPASPVMDLTSSKTVPPAPPGPRAAVAPRQRPVPPDAASAEAAVAEAAKAVAEAQAAVRAKIADAEELKKLSIEKAKELEKIKSETKVLVDTLTDIQVSGSVFSGVPGSIPVRVERIGDKIAADGIEKIVIKAGECQVRIRGWEKSDVSYSLTTLSRSKDGNGLKASGTRSGNQITITVPETAAVDIPMPIGSECILDIAVPRKSNISVSSNQGIRIQDVKGNLELAADGGTVDIRDSEGRLSLKGSDAIIRVVGFAGELTAEMGEIEAFLDGDFSSIDTRSTAGAIVLNLPAGTGADITAPEDGLKIEGFPTARRIADNRWTLGNGGRKYLFGETDTVVTIRTRDHLYVN